MTILSREIGKLVQKYNLTGAIVHQGLTEFKGGYTLETELSVDETYWKLILTHHGITKEYKIVPLKPIEMEVTDNE